MQLQSQNMCCKNSSYGSINEPGHAKKYKMVKVSEF